MEQYEKLRKELPEIAKVVSLFPEPVQGKAFDVLVSSLIEGALPSKLGAIQITNPIAAPSESTTTCMDIAGVAMKDTNGQFHFSVRDVKASNAIDAVKRLTYVLIRAYIQVMGVKTVSRKAIINPHLSAWRLYNGNARRFIAGDPGIIKNGDELSLDVHAEKEADTYIKEILDANVQGKWKRGTK